jgi:hypothetical protein
MRPAIGSRWVWRGLGRGDRKAGCVVEVMGADPRNRGFAIVREVRTGHRYSQRMVPGGGYSPAR